MSIYKVTSELETARLTLRHPLPKQDAVTTFRAIKANRGRLQAYFGCLDDINSVEAERKRLSTKMIKGSPVFSWLIFQKPTQDLKVPSSNGFVGMISAGVVQQTYCTLWWWLIKEAQGQGYMTEAARAVEAEIWNRGAQGIFIKCNTDNTKSMAVIGRMGYSLGSKGNLKKQDTLVTFMKMHPRLTEETKAPLPV